MYVRKEVTGRLSCSELKVEFEDVGLDSRWGLLFYMHPYDHSRDLLEISRMICV